MEIEEQKYKRKKACLVKRESWWRGTADGGTVYVCCVKSEWNGNEERMKSRGDKWGYLRPFFGIIGFIILIFFKEFVVKRWRKILYLRLKLFIERMCNCR